MKCSVDHLDLAFARDVCTNVHNIPFDFKSTYR